MFYFYSKWLFYSAENKLIIFYYMLTLNSVVNPWIYMMFNFNLVESLKVILCPCFSRRAASRPVSPNNPLRSSKKFMLCCKTDNQGVKDNGSRNPRVDRVTTSLLSPNQQASMKRSRKSSSPPQETQVTFCRLTPTKMV